jgi:hypothetical protein
MSDEIKRAAIIMAEAALLGANIAMMQAANAVRARADYSPAYGENDFAAEIRSHPLLEPGNAARFMAGD